MSSRVGAAHRTTCVVHGNPDNPDNPGTVRMSVDRVALINWDETRVDVPDLDLVLPHNAAGLDDRAHDIAAQASAALPSLPNVARSARRGGTHRAVRRAIHIVIRPSVCVRHLSRAASTALVAGTARVGCTTGDGMSHHCPPSGVSPWMMTLDGDAFDLSLVEAVPRDGTERHGCDRGTCSDASPPAPPHRGWVGVGNQRSLVGTEAAGVDRVGDGAPRVPKVSDDGFVARAFERVGAGLGHRRCLRRWSRARWWSERTVAAGRSRGSAMVVNRRRDGQLAARLPCRRLGAASCRGSWCRSGTRGPRRPAPR